MIGDDNQRPFLYVPLSGPGVDEVVIGGLAVDLSKNMSTSVAWASDGEFAAAVVPLNLQVEVGMTAGIYPAFSPKCVLRYGLQGAKIALAGCPTPKVRAVLKEIVRAEGLPYSPLGGPFALDAEENRGSYLFATVSESNVDEWIELGRRGGFAEIHLCPWWHRLGHYEPHPGQFPHGLAGLKQVTDKLHAAGFKVGMHTLTGGIQVDDPWVSPIPDKRLMKDARFTLAAAVGADDKVIPTIERPEGLETFWSDMSTGNTLQIGDEIVAYSGISQKSPYGFAGCTRGQWGTKRSAHEQGATAQHLVATYCSYIPDEDSTLVDELAECIAKVFNTCGFDMIYLDGSEGMRTAHAVAKMKRAIFTRLKGRVLVESSSGSWAPGRTIRGSGPGITRCTASTVSPTCTRGPAALQRQRASSRTHGMVGHHRALRRPRRHVPGRYGVLRRQVPRLGLVHVGGGRHRRPDPAQRAAKRVPHSVGALSSGCG